MEGALRPFIDARPDETLGVLGQWAWDDNYHVRRLVSESTRPRLPWAPRMALDPAASLPLLDVLHSDPTRYVTRSVANHLNDIAKTAPQIVVETLSRWREEARQEQGELEWITRHALRTLIKQGDPRAMAMLGFSPDPAVAAATTSVTGWVRPGSALLFTVTLTARRNEKLLIDYVIDFVKKSGGTGPKVFKLRQLELLAGGAARLEKRHVLRADASTYSLYPGRHRLTVMANGTAVASTHFEVTSI